jgi:hypothetical protein
MMGRMVIPKEGSLDEEEKSLNYQLLWRTLFLSYTISSEIIF